MKVPITIILAFDEGLWLLEDNGPPKVIMGHLTAKQALDAIAPKNVFNETVDPQVAVLTTYTDNNVASAYWFSFCYNPDSRPDVQNSAHTRGEEFIQDQHQGTAKTKYSVLLTEMDIAPEAIKLMTAPLDAPTQNIVDPKNVGDNPMRFGDAVTCPDGQGTLSFLVSGQAAVDLDEGGTWMGSIDYVHAKAPSPSYEATFVANADSIWRHIYKPGTDLIVVAFYVCGEDAPAAYFVQPTDDRKTLTEEEVLAEVEHFGGEEGVTWFHENKNSPSEHISPRLIGSD